MSWATDAADGLEAAGIGLVVYLPDTKLMPLIEEAQTRDTFDTVLVTREEEGIGVAAGAWLGGQRAAMLCQSSGLMNTFNAFASLAIPARIPLLGMTMRRGDLGEFNIAQIPGGYGLPRMLEELGVRNHCLDRPEDVRDRTQMAVETAFATCTPYVVLLETTVTGYKKVNQ